MPFATRAILTSLLLLGHFLFWLNFQLSELSRVLIPFNLYLSKFLHSATLLFLQLLSSWSNWSAILESITGQFLCADSKIQPRLFQTRHLSIESMIYQTADLDGVISRCHHCHLPSACGPMIRHMFVLRVVHPKTAQLIIIRSYSVPYRSSAVSTIVAASASRPKIFIRLYEVWIHMHCSVASLMLHAKNLKVSSWVSNMYASMHVQISLLSYHVLVETTELKSIAVSSMLIHSLPKSSSFDLSLPSPNTAQTSSSNSTYIAPPRGAPRYPYRPWSGFLVCSAQQHYCAASPSNLHWEQIAPSCTISSVHFYASTLSLHECHQHITLSLLL